MVNEKNSASRNFILSASVWLVIGGAMGLTMAFEFVFPDLFKGISWLVFSRLRQAHTNTVMFAWLTGGMMGLWFYIVPRLTGRSLWSEKLGNLSVILWNISVAVGIVGILTAHTQSREYAEFIWIVDVLVMLVLIINMINLFQTIANRVEKKLYVSLWYISGSLIWMPMLYLIGNIMWNPPTGAITGINDAVFNWFYGHNVLGLWFTTGLLPVVYYIVPRETKTPLYSHFLSLIAFWTLLFFYTGVGAHHLLWTPIPYWLKTVAVAESIGMLIPVLAIMTNIYLTMRGNWGRITHSFPLRFILTGWIAYILVSFQGAHQALRSINLLTHFSQYVPAHAHLALMFFSASVVIGGAYYVIPRIFNCRIYSRNLANTQYVIYLIGFIMFFIGFTSIGFVQGTNWLHQGLPVWSVLPGLRPFMALRAMGGVIIATSFVLFAVNIIMTTVKRIKVSEPALDTEATRIGLQE